VLRPGGRIALCNWTPQGYIGRFFATLSPYMPAPPAGVSPPPRWGDPDHVTALFEGTGITLSFARRTVDFRDDFGCDAGVTDAHHWFQRVRARFQSSPLPGRKCHPRIQTKNRERRSYQ